MSLKKYFDREPVFVALGASAAVGWVMTWLVEKGVLSNTQASATTQAVMPAVVAGILIGLGVVVREFVTPVAKHVEPDVEGWVHRYAPALDEPLAEWEKELSAGLDEAGAYAEASAQDGPSYPPTAALGDAILPDAGPSEGSLKILAPGTPLSDVPAAEPMNAGAQPDTAAVTVSGQMTGTLGGLA